MLMQAKLDFDGEASEMGSQMNCHVIVVNVLEKKSAFAVRMDTGEQCFVPASVVRAAEAWPGQRREVMLVPNALEDKRESTPWVVAFMHPLSGEDASEPVSGSEEAELASELIREASDLTEDLVMSGGVWTHTEVCEELFGPDGATKQQVNAVGKTLRRLHKDGRVARWAFYRKGTQVRSSVDYWGAYPDGVEVCEVEEVE